MIKMKTFKRLIGLLLATSVTTGLMVGCGSSKSTDDSSKGTESEEAVTDESSEEEPTVVTAGDEMVLNLKCGHSLNYMLNSIKKWLKSGIRKIQIKQLT